MEFDLKEGRKRRDQGMETAIAHADAQIEGWADGAYLLLEKFIHMSKDDFMTEDVRHFAHVIYNYPLPPDGRAWGGVVHRAVRQNLIYRVGYAPMKSKNCHANPKSVWRKAQDINDI
jgi:hypothetical protein